MATVRALLTYQLRTLAPFASGPMEDRAGVDGQPVLSGSMIKGTVRHLAARLAVSLGGPVCRADGDPSCVVCRLFGAPGLGAALRWSDALLVPGRSEAPGGEPLFGLRDRQPVLRSRRVFAPALVPARRVAVAGLTFAGRADGWLGGRADGEARDDLALAATALRLLTRVGGGRSLGCGRVTVELKAVELNGQRYAPGDLIEGLLAGGQV